MVGIMRYGFEKLQRKNYLFKKIRTVLLIHGFEEVKK